LPPDEPALAALGGHALRGAEGEGEVFAPSLPPGRAVPLGAEPGVA